MVMSARSARGITSGGMSDGCETDPDEAWGSGRLRYRFDTAGRDPDKAQAPGSLVNKGKQGPRYVVMTVGFELCGTSSADASG